MVYYYFKACMKGRGWMGKRTSFQSRVGFVLAAAGSAVGLGNLWRFPYLAAKYGGGIFLLVYILLAFTFGFALMITELAIGRKTQVSCIGAYKALDKRFGFLGYLSTLVPMIILPYYCVIGGWVVKYLWEFLTGQGEVIAQNSQTFFDSFIAVSGSGVGSNPIVWFLLFVVLTATVVLFGVEKGIERVSRWMMPLLVLLSIFVAVFSLTMPGAMVGLRYYLLPDFSKFSTTTVLAAVGQLFYSMSLSMGIMITYGSYMKKEEDLERSVHQIEWFDTGIALIAGLMVVPAVVAFNGGDPESINAGPGLMFVTLPRVFESMKFGGIIGTAFFLLVLLAALTSSISMMETVVSIVRDKLHWNRKRASLLVAGGTALAGLLPCLGYSGAFQNFLPLGMPFLDFFDFISNSVLMPIVAILTCILVGHVLGVSVITEEITREGHSFSKTRLHRVMIRWIAPLLLVAILVSELLKQLGMFTI